MTQHWRAAAVKTNFCNTSLQKWGGREPNANAMRRRILIARRVSDEAVISTALGLLRCAQ